MPTIRDLAFAKSSLLKCEGFNPAFIDPGTRISITRTLSPEYRTVLPDVEGNAKKLLHYTNLSVLYHAERRVPFLSAYNIDGGKKIKGIKRASSFHPDPRLDASVQLSQEGFYDLRKDITEFEIGHMAANDEMAWGTDAQLKAYQTFHFPNSVPQAERLNTGIWKSLESYIIGEAASMKQNKRISVLTGPVLRPDDPQYNRDPDFRIPLLFFKVIIFPTPLGLRSTAFLMSHEQRMIEQRMFLTSPLEMLESGEGVGIPHFNDFKYRKVFQVGLTLLEDLTGLNFSWPGVKRVRIPDDKQLVQKIRKVRDAKDAKKHLEGRRFSRQIGWERSDADLTPREMKTKDFRLTLRLD